HYLKRLRLLQKCRPACENALLSCAALLHWLIQTHPIQAPNKKYAKRYPYSMDQNKGIIISDAFRLFI
ncbi:hypothetical protein N9Y97_10860, partial [Pseudomonadales bacterium]|nr:hypothetical protein [Pseudomonadales bacterium]